MGSTENQALTSTHRVPDSKFHPVHTKMDVIKKGHAKDSQRYKVDYESQSTDTQNFSSESKRETEYVSAFPFAVEGGAARPGHLEITGLLFTQEPRQLFRWSCCLSKQPRAHPYRRAVDPPLRQRSPENLQAPAGQRGVLTRAVHVASECPGLWVPVPVLCLALRSQKRDREPWLAAAWER